MVNLTYVRRRGVIASCINGCQTMQQRWKTIEDETREKRTLNKFVTMCSPYATLQQWNLRGYVIKKSNTVV